jgi:hypothetical protein
MALPALSTYASVSASAPPLFMAEQASRFSASEIRHAIAYWVGQNRLDLAEALVVAGISQYPRSEDILALGALVSEVYQDWPLAQDRLEQLMTVQGAQVPAETLHHFVRVLNCRGAYFKAYLESQKALERFPRHEGLRQLHAELKALMESVSMKVSSVQAVP